jgi:hypothetical protein
LAIVKKPLEDESTVEGLIVGQICTQEGFRKFKRVSPMVRGLKGIHFGFKRITCAVHRKLIRAFKKNMTLEKIDFHCPNIRTEIQSCCDRSKCIPRWIADPDAVAVSLWPNIYESALDYEHRYDGILRGLIAMGDRLGEQTIEGVSGINIS